jgi:phytanoyl-CoA hydroxylase
MSGLAQQTWTEARVHGDLAEMREQFRRDGFVVIRRAAPPGLCAAAAAAFDADVKTARRFYFLRHESGTYERHVFTQSGFMKYPIMNLQDLPDRFERFRQLGLRVVTQSRIRGIVAALLGEPGRCIHTMFFDGNQNTWAHRDSHYIDSQEIGAMVGVWVAAEDIHSGAGRFYVYRGSHRVPTPPELGIDSLDPNKLPYRQTMAKWLAESGLEQVVPELNRGDAVLWNALTIHGALPTTDPDHSRKSFTAHYVPESHDYIAERRVAGSSRETVFNETRIVLRGDQGRWVTQARGAVRAALLRYPALWRMTGGLRSALRRR